MADNVEQEMFNFSPGILEPKHEKIDFEIL